VYDVKIIKVQLPLVQVQ